MKNVADLLLMDGAKAHQCGDENDKEHFMKDFGVNTLWHSRNAQGHNLHMATTQCINTMKMKTHIPILLFTAVITVGCNKNRTASEQLDQVQEKTADVAQDMKDYTFVQKEEFVTKMRAELAALDLELDELAAKVERSSSTVKADAQPRIDALRERTARLNQQLDEATNATESNWNKFKAEIRTTSDGAKEEFKQARQWLSEKIAP